MAKGIEKGLYTYTCEWVFEHGCMLFNVCSIIYNYRGCGADQFLPLFPNWGRNVITDRAFGGWSTSCTPSPLCVCLCAFYLCRCLLWMWVDVWICAHIYEWMLMWVWLWIWLRERELVDLHRLKKSITIVWLDDFWY